VAVLVSGAAVVVLVSGAAVAVCVSGAAVAVLAPPRRLAWQLMLLAYGRNSTLGTNAPACGVQGMSGLRI
jgi:hypothetical protein